jgi:predicted  nucleic acid-binding Zn-ribbon protein
MRSDKLLETFLQKIDPEHARSSGTLPDDPYGECMECAAEMVFSSNEALFTCPKCGYQEFVLVDSDKPSYKDPPREVSYYAYKRINHFNEWLAQIQAKESTDIPQEVFDAIMAELKKERITELGNIKTSKICS